MVSTDLDAPAPVTCSIAAKSPSGSPRYGVSVLLISSFVLGGAVLCRAQSQQEQDQGQNQTQEQKNQDVAEAARQERTRKETQQRKSKHVYTAEDLKRERILTPEDRAELEARKNSPASSPASGSQNPQGAVDGSAVAQDATAASPSANSANVPLGDVARRLRREKESQQLQRSAQFPLPFADAPVLASPKAPAQPLRSPVAVDPPTAVLPAPRVVAPLRPFVKRSPFERPRILPEPPAAPRKFVPPAPTLVPEPRALAPASPAPPALKPAPLAPRVQPAPSPPRVVPSPKISGKLMLVTVKPGDSLWKFAASRLGDGRRWQELLSLNPALRHPDLLEVGSQIVVPASLAPPHAPTKYTVRLGDTLWSIAQTQLHHGSFWSCIANANSDLRDANLLHEGQVLLIPSSCPK